MSIFTGGSRTMRVVVVGAPPGAAGGIGVLMDHLSKTTSPDSELLFLNSGAVAGRRIQNFFSTLLRLSLNANDYQLAHLNLSVRGSTVRKTVIAQLLRLLRKPYVLHLHSGAYADYYEALPKLQKRVVRALFRRADRVIVLGSSWQESVSDLLGVKKEKISVIPNAVPGPENLQSKATTGQILFAGRLSANKGVPELLEVSRRLRYTPTWRLRLAGDIEGPSVSTLLKAAPAEVSAMGWLLPEALSELLRTSNIYVLPSHSEGLPLALLDAMAHGLAPVVSPVGSIPEVIQHERNGLIVLPGDHDNLRTALQRLLDDPGLTSRLGAAARRTWEERYDIRNYRRRLDDEYASILGCVS